MMMRVKEVTETSSAVAKERAVRRRNSFTAAEPPPTEMERALPPRRPGAGSRQTPRHSASQLAPQLLVLDGLGQHRLEGHLRRLAEQPGEEAHRRDARRARVHGLVRERTETLGGGLGQPGAGRVDSTATPASLTPSTSRSPKTSAMTNERRGPERGGLDDANGPGTARRRRVRPEGQSGEAEERQRGRHEARSADGGRGCGWPAEVPSRLRPAVSIPLAKAAATMESAADGAAGGLVSERPNRPVTRSVVNIGSLA